MDILFFLVSSDEIEFNSVNATEVRSQHLKTSKIRISIAPAAFAARDKTSGIKY